MPVTAATTCQSTSYDCLL